jgi:Ca2+-binding EF-hand superfamily protein
MKRTIVSTWALLAVLATAGVSHADDTDASSARLQRLVDRFHKADVNGDGQLTRDEAKQGMPRVYQHFSEIDRENRGFVTLAQIASFLEAHPRMEQRRGEAPPSPPSTAAPAPTP